MHILEFLDTKVKQEDSIDYSKILLLCFLYIYVQFFRASGNGKLNILKNMKMWKCTPIPAKFPYLDSKMDTEKFLWIFLKIFAYFSEPTS